MSNILNPENAVFSFINKIVDLIWLGILWTVTSLALVTVGPATSALYYAVVKVIRRERGYVTKAFFHSFKENLKPGIIAGGLFWILVVLMYIDFTYASAMSANGETFGTVMVVVFMCVTVFAVFIYMWIYPILSRFTLGFRPLLINSLLISVKHFPRTLLMIAFYGAVGYLIYSFVPLVFYIFIPIILPGISALLKSFVVEPVLKKYMAEPEGTPEETGEDQWYRE